MLFRGSPEECKELFEWLNSLIPGIVKFKFEYSQSRIEFLDLQIFIEDKKLKISLFIKPGNLQLYLDFSPQPIVYSQALRIVERCSLPEDLESNLEKFDEARKKNRK